MSAGQTFMMMIMMKMTIMMSRITMIFMMLNSKSYGDVLYALLMMMMKLSLFYGENISQSYPLD